MYVRALVSTFALSLPVWSNHPKWLTPALVVSAVGVVLKGYDSFKSRQRFGVRANVDRVGELWVRLLPVKDPVVYVEAVNVVVVKSWLYRGLRKLRHGDKVGHVGLAPIRRELTKLDRPLEFTARLPERGLLPPRRNPWGSFTNRKWKRREIRLQVTVSTKEKDLYMRIKKAPGVRAVGREEAGPPAGMKERRVVVGDNRQSDQGGR